LAGRRGWRALGVTYLRRSWPGIQCRSTTTAGKRSRSSRARCSGILDSTLGAVLKMEGFMERRGNPRPRVFAIDAGESRGLWRSGSSPAGRAGPIHFRHASTSRRCARGPANGSLAEGTKGFVVQNRFAGGPHAKRERSGPAAPTGPADAPWTEPLSVILRSSSIRWPVCTGAGPSRLRRGDEHSQTLLLKPNLTQTRP